MSTFIKGPALVESIESITSAGGTTTLVFASKTFQRVTGTLAQTIVLPDATTLAVGRRFIVVNESTQDITVQNSTLSLQKTVRFGHNLAVVLQNNASAGGAWSVYAEGGLEANGQVLFGDTLSGFKSSVSLFWDATNNRLGIGTASPSVPFDVNGAARIRGLTVAGVVITDASGNLTSEARLALSRFATGTLNHVLIGQGASDSLYALLTNANIDVAAGIARSKLASGTAHRIVVNNGSGVMSELGPLTDGQVLIGSTGAAAVPATLTGTTNRVTVTNGAGSITLSGPQDIHLGAKPTFAGLTITGETNFPDVDVSTSGNIDALLNTSSGVRLTGTAVVLRGITAGASGQIMFIRNVTGGSVTISNENGTPSAANRILTGTGADLVVASNASVIARYDLTTARWAIVGGSGGGSGGGSYAVYSNLTLAAAGTITITSDGFQTWRVQGNSAAVTLSTTPFGGTPPTTGTTFTLIGNSDTNTVTLTNNDIANGCLLNGTSTLTLARCITIQYNGNLARYVELNRNF